LRPQIAHAASAAVADDAYVVEAIARNAIVWDVRPSDAYAAGHISGAVNIGDAPRVLRDDNTEDFIATDRIEKILGAAGLDPKREIIAMAAGAPGCRISVIHDTVFRRRQRARLSRRHRGMDYGWPCHRPRSADDGTRCPQARNRPNVAATTKDVLERLHEPNVQIVDARTPQEFAGEDIRAIRSGHIPGALNIPYEQNWVDPETPAKLSRKQVTSNAGMSLKSVADLKRLYSKLDPSKETIVYCQSGARASETAGVLQELGFTKVKVYDSSWLGYGNTLDAPAENVTFFNVGLLTSRLSTLQERVNQLERELADAKARK
jgi:thiosulfate/3-mercaptopyruvate sulfurtransferase